LYYLDVQDQTGDWRVTDDATADKSFDYRQMGPVRRESVSQILSEHTTKAVALTASLLWEDHSCARSM
jgi:hypothetical protein